LITAHSKVTLHFSLHTQHGVEVDSNFDQSPATFVIGDGNLLPGFENVLRGLQAGDEKTFSLAPKEAFGDINRDSIHVLERREFGTLDLSEGLGVSFDGAGKLAMPGIVKKIDGEKITVDFNHPLAGKDLVFDLELVAVL